MAEFTVRHRLERGVLLAPAAIAKAAARQARRPEEQWMLKQPKNVRASYVREVMDKGADERLAQIWILRQSNAVRDSYIKEVLQSDR